MTLSVPAIAIAAFGLVAAHRRQKNLLCSGKKFVQPHFWCALLNSCTFCIPVGSLQISAKRRPNLPKVPLVAEKWGRIGNDHLLPLAYVNPCLITLAQVAQGAVMKG